MSRKHYWDLRRKARAHASRRRPAAGLGGTSFGRTLKFETLENRLLLTSDFGDAPAPYPTTVANGGANHADIGPTLGTARDSEPNGTPSILANSDDTNPVGGIDDEDGVIFGAIRAGQTGATVIVNVQDASSGALLDAWIDFNKDGNWGGADEHIFDRKSVVVGDNNLRFAVPVDVVPGTVFARFRLSTSTDVGIRGAVSDGEVEDYAITILPPGPSGGVLEVFHSLGTEDVYTPINPVDMDRDGDMDLLTAQPGTGVRWYENDGTGHFTSHGIPISHAFTSTMAAADFDGDGDIDLMSFFSIYSFSYDVVWFENNNNLSFTAHEGGDFYDDVDGISVADVNGDGRLDGIVSTGNAIYAQINQGNGQFSQSYLAEPRTWATAADINRDGRMDLLSLDFAADNIAWLENQGSVPYVVRAVAAIPLGNILYPVAVDFDRDGDIDIVGSSPTTNDIVWFRNNGTQTFTQTSALATNSNTRAFEVLDVDGDGDMDVIGQNPQQFTWYENNGTQVFTSHAFAVGAGISSIFSADDVDNDGDVDLFVLKYDGELGWLENVDIVQSVVVSPATVSEENGPYLVYTFTRAGETIGPLTVNFTIDATAHVGSDFTVSGALSFSGTSGSVSMPGAVSTVQIVLSPLDDAAVELSEYVSLRLAAGEHYIVGDLTSARGTITSAEFGGDFGDAPLPYPTTAAENGAQHGAYGPTLGALRDSEATGVHAAGANGEAEDDGVTFGTIRVGQIDATVQVDVQNAPSGARLDAWFDFNADGSWGGPGEQIFDNRALVAGNNVLTFDVPSWANDGVTYARFRLSTKGDLGVVGAVDDGEVEDYSVTITPAAHSGNVLAKEVVGSSVNLGSIIGTADFDHDSDIDLIGSNRSWYENDGSEHFVQHQVNSATGAWIEPVDIDGDGDIDVLGSDGTTTIAWWENGGTSSFVRHDITTSLDYVSSVYAADMDRDGDIDVLATSLYQSRIEWYENDGYEHFTSHIVATLQLGVSDVIAADLDRDGDMDVASTSSSGAQIVWHENNGQQSFVAHTVASSSYGATSVFASDVDSDGDIDLLSASDTIDQVAWYENNGSGSFALRVITSTAEGVDFVSAADIDGDGDTDVIASNDYTLAWYENNGSQTFIKHAFLEPLQYTGGAIVADLNGDNMLDLVYSLSNSLDTYWLRNQYMVSVSAAPASVSEESAAPLAYTFTRVGGTIDPLVVSFKISGDAKYGEDYTVSGAATYNGATGTIVIPAGALSAQITITPIDDAIVELNEILQLKVIDGIGYVAGISPVASGTITSAELGGDFGDAPLPYATTLADNGARHSATAGTGPTLGASRDEEVDGTQTAQADGDDTTGSDDEQGVTLTGYQVGLLGATAIVNVQNAPNGARLDAWIDFNGDGNWNGAAEYVVQSVFVHNGNHTLEFDVPSDALPGVTYGRFRISTVGNLAATGPASDGEVEDYAIPIYPTPPAFGAFGLQHVMSSSASNVSPSSVIGLIAVDLDQDGDMDSVSASYGNSRLLFHERIGADQYATTMLANELSVYGVRAGDLDRDGDIDLVTVSASSDAISWYEHESGMNFVRRLIATPDEVFSAELVDLDGDGDLDIVSQSYWADEIDWYENDGNGTFVSHVVATGVDGVSTIFPQDINGDGHIDILSVSDNDDKLRWWQNDGLQNFTEHLITSIVNPNALVAADMDGDGDADVITANEANPYSIYIMENDGAGGFTQHTAAVASPINNLNLRVADLDGDGDLDIYGTTSSWYRNDGSFNFVAVATNGGKFAADMDGDGDLDLLDSGNAVVWRENSDAAVSVVAAPATIDEDAAIASTVTFTRNGLSLAPLTVPFSVGGSATMGTDYSLLGAVPSGTRWAVTFGDGQSTAVVNIVPIADDLLETSESVSITLQPEPNVATASPSSATVTITGTDPIDWGDAPAPYLTLSASDGARHGATGPRIGAARDGEANGQPTIAANGDDATGVDDEDGVAFSAIVPGMTHASATVNVQNAPMGARLTAWLDFDNDGSWAGALERIVADVAVVAGDNTLTFQVPAGAFIGNTYARFRLRSDEGLLGPNGAAADGEVEDHLVTIGPTIPAAGPGDYPHNLISTGGGEVGVFAIDVDRDGDMDAITASSTDDTIAWNENDGTGIFTHRVISTAADGARSVYAADIDADGDIDIVSASIVGDRIHIYLNQGNQTFTTTALATAINGASSVVIADLDRDNRLDIVFAARDASQIGYFAQTAANSYTYRLLASPSGAKSVTVADVDNDGDLDVVAAASIGDAIFWYENQGPTTFASRTVATGLDGASAVYAIDLDRDGDTDIISGAELGTAVRWYENNGSQVFTARNIKTGTAGTTSVYTADVDGDGDYDVLAASATIGRFEWFKNDGAQSFTLQTTDATATGAYALVPADFDRDGDLDLLTQTTAGAVVWYENAATSMTVASSSSTVGEDTATAVVFTFTRATALTNSLTVPFSVGGTAPLGVDYTQAGATTFSATSGTVTFAPGASTAQFSITPIADADSEDDETIVITLLPGTTYAITSPAVGVTTIIDHSLADFGDAPSPYPTLHSQNAARHAPTGPTLGAARDSELDGQPAAGATGDDATGSDDEDGVTFGALQAGHSGSIMTVNVQNAPAGARLDAWIDFDGDGNWSGALERVATDMPVVNGSNIITFDIPGFARLGSTFARLRLSTAGGLSPVGWAADGEVEDHAVTIMPPGGAPGFVSDARTIVNVVQAGGVVADIDRDGDFDVLAAVQSSSQIAWYVNDGNQGFTTQMIVGNRPNVSWLQAVDMDRDGDLDVLATMPTLATGASSFVAWYKNNGSLGFTEHIIQSSTTTRMSTLFAADIDSDGDMDFVSSGNTSTTALDVLYLNDGQQNFSQQTIVSNTTLTRAVTAADVNRDGRVDIIVGTTTSSTGVTWYENLGTGAFASHLMSSQVTNAFSLAAADVDLDGDVDIVYGAGASFRMGWIEQKPGGVFTNHALSIPTGQVDSVQVADMDGDGDMDLLSVSLTTGLIAFYRNDGQQNFTFRYLNGQGGAFTVYPADMDRDGDLDIVTLSVFGKLAWYESLNYIPPQGDYNRSGVVESGDYDLWRISFGSTTALLADASGNNAIDAGDYVLWRKNLGSMAPGLGAATALISQPDSRFVSVDLAMITFQAHRGSRTARFIFDEQHQAASPALAQNMLGTLLNDVREDRAIHLFDWRPTNDAAYEQRPSNDVIGAVFTQIGELAFATKRRRQHLSASDLPH